MKTLDANKRVHKATVCGQTIKYQHVKCFIAVSSPYVLFYTI